MISFVKKTRFFTISFIELLLISSYGFTNLVIQGFYTIA